MQLAEINFVIPPVKLTIQCHLYRPNIFLKADCVKMYHQNLGACGKYKKDFLSEIKAWHT